VFRSGQDKTPCPPYAGGPDLIKSWLDVRRAFNDYVWEPLFVGANVGLVLARIAWGLWFALLSFLTLINFSYRDPMTDVEFAQSVSIVSAIAILCTLRPTIKSQRLHCLMLALSCIVYIGLQRPMAFTPHGTFLRTFTRVKPGMTTYQVRSIMFSYIASDDHYKHQMVFVNSEAGRQWWFHEKYSGKIHLRHSDPDYVDGFFDITFQNGIVVDTYCFNE
jgi:hypothetical protein